MCELVRKLLNIGAYDSFVQDTLVQAECGFHSIYRLQAALSAAPRYWQDPLNEDEFVNKSVLLADVNNCRPAKNETYRTNLQSVNAFAMVQFLNDTIVQPRESEVRCKASG